MTSSTLSDKSLTSLQRGLSLSGIQFTWLSCDLISLVSSRKVIILLIIQFFLVVRMGATLSSSFLHPKHKQNPLTFLFFFWVLAPFTLFFTLVFFLFLKNSFIEIYFTYHKIHPFKLYNSLVSSIFTELCNHHQNQFYNISSSPKETLDHLAATHHFPLTHPAPSNN